MLARRGRRGAVASFTKALAVEPNDPDALLYLGLTYMYGNAIQRGLEVGEQLRTLDPLSTTGWMLLGTTTWYVSSWTESVRAVERARELRRTKLSSC